MAIKAEKYTKGKFLYPSHDLPPEEKLKAPFNAAYARSHYASWCKNRTGGITRGSRDQMVKNRMYLCGDQDRRRYEKLFYGENDGIKALREGMHSINFDILKIIVRYINAGVGKFNEVDYDVDMESYSMFVRAEKEKSAMTNFIRTQLKEKGIDVKGGEKDGIQADNMEELRLLQSMGAFPHQLEYAYEAIIDQVFREFGGWGTHMKTLFLRDLFAFHKIAAWDYVDGPTQKMLTKYLDPVDVIVRKTKDGRIIDGGYLELMTIAELRRESGLPEETLMNAAKCYTNMLGNPWSWNYTGDAYLKRGALGNCEYDDYRVLVFHCEYQSFNKEFLYQNMAKPGQPVGRTSYGKTYPNSESRKSIVKGRIDMYKCSLIIGMDGDDAAYNYGLQYDQARPNMAEVKPSLHYYEVEGPSPIQCVENVLDAIQLIWLKNQNAWGNAEGNGMMFDETVLRNTTIGQKMKPTDIIRMGRATGIYFFSSTNDKNKPTMAPNAGHPFQKVEGGVGQIQQEFAEQYALLNNMLSDFMGFSDASIGAPVDGKAVAEYQLQATNTTLKPISDALKEIKLSMSTNIALRTQVLMRYSEPARRYYSGIIGESIVKVLQVSTENPDKDYTQFGLKVNVTNNSEIRQLILQGARESQQAGRNGLPGITWVEFSQITRLLKSGAPLQYVEALIGRLEEKRRQQMEDAKNKNLEVQSQAQAAGNMALVDGQKDLETHKANEKIRIELVKAWAKDYTEEKKGINQMDQQIAGIMMKDLVAPIVQSQMPQNAPAAM